MGTPGLKDLTFLKVIISMFVINSQMEKTKNQQPRQLMLTMPYRCLAKLLEMRTSTTLESYFSLPKFGLPRSIGTSDRTATFIRRILL
jgi:hypothetical protein